MLKTPPRKFLLKKKKKISQKIKYKKSLPLWGENKKKGPILAGEFFPPPPKVFFLWFIGKKLGGAFCLYEFSTIFLFIKGIKS